MAEKRLTLAEACAPFFVYLTTFRRNAETSGLGLPDLQEAIRGGIEFIGNRCEEDRRLAPLFERVWYALVVTADQVVLGSSWPNRPAWAMNLLETHYFKSMEGGSKFFRLAEDVLNDGSEDAPELAEVLFTCMALGFQGELIGERRELERKRRQLFEKARLHGATGERLTPESYERNAPDVKPRLPTVGILRFVIITLAAVLFALLAGNSVTAWKNRALVTDIQAASEALSKPPPSSR